MKSSLNQSTLSKALELLINQNDSAVKLQVITTYGHILLTDAADKVITDLINNSSDDLVIGLLKINQEYLNSLRKKITAFDILRFILQQAEQLVDQLSGDKAKNIEEAIALYNLALEGVLDNSTKSLIQNDLGFVYLKRILGDKSENLEQSIQLFQSSLDLISQTKEPKTWALIHSNLGLAYSDRIEGGFLENREKSIVYSQKALEIFTYENYPNEWATTHHNLMKVFPDRLRGDRADNIEKAIFHGKEALKVRTKDTSPYLWARTSYNIGKTYADRIMGDPKENFETAIRYLFESLEVFTISSNPDDWAWVHQDIGITYLKNDKDISKAIECFQKSLSVWKQNTDPDRWANTQFVLGQSLARQYNFKDALIYYNEALKVYTPDSHPNRWAQVQESIAYLYITNEKKALSQLDLAKKISTRYRAPLEYRNLQLELGDRHFKNQDWAEAQIAYLSADKIHKTMLGDAFTEVGQYHVVGETANMYASLAYSLIKTGDYNNAFLALEKGKTQILTNFFLKNDLSLNLLSEEYKDQIEETRLAELQIDEILKSIPVDTAIIAPFATTKGGAVFIIPYDTKTIEQKHIFFLDAFNLNTIKQMLFGNETKKGWLTIYQDYRYNLISTSEMEREMDEFTHKLWDLIMRPIHEMLILHGASKVIIIPYGGLQVLPLHAAWRNIGNKKRYFLDNYTTSYIPSAHTLKICSNRSKNRDKKTGIVIGINKYLDPHILPLEFAVTESETISALLHTHPLNDSHATKDIVLEAIPYHGIVHLACHAKFGWDGKAMSSGVNLFDNPLLLEDLLTLKLLDVRLVVLSACETGLTEVSNSSNEFLGITTGFIQAGTPAVVSSLWKVNDYSTQMLMERFYKNQLVEKMNIADSLREAEIWLRDSAEDGRFSNPLYWASFIFTGA